MAERTQIDGGQIRGLGNLTFIDDISDFPAPIGGVITLPHLTSWLITREIDLMGNRIVTSGSVCVFGASQETCRVSSTGLVGQPLLEAQGILNLRTIAFSSNTGQPSIFLNGTATDSYDWQYVNFYGNGYAVNANNLNNLVLEGLALLSGGGFVFNGSSNSIVYSNSILVPSTGQPALTFNSGATINRRLRLTNCVAIIGTGATGIRFLGPNLTIPESFILDTVSFTGSGTYLVGVSYLNDTTRFLECRGILNTARMGQYYWTSNATATTITTPGTFVKVAGVSTPGSDNQRFSHSNNRVTYTSATQTGCTLTATISLTATINNIISIAFFKNGVEIPGTRQKVTANNLNRAENITIIGITTLNLGDYIEVWLTNNNTIPVVVEDLSVIVRGLL